MLDRRTDKERLLEISTELMSIKKDLDSLCRDVAARRSESTRLDRKIEAMNRDLVALKARPSPLLVHKCDREKDIESNTKNLTFTKDEIVSISKLLATLAKEVEIRFNLISKRNTIILSVLTVLLVPTLSAFWFTFDSNIKQRELVNSNTKSIAKNTNIIEKNSKLIIDNTSSIKMVGSKMADNNDVDRILLAIEEASNRAIGVIESDQIKRKLNFQEQKQLRSLLKKVRER